MVVGTAPSIFQSMTQPTAACSLPPSPQQGPRGSPSAPETPPGKGGLRGWQISAGTPHPRPAQGRAACVSPHTSPANPAEPLLQAPPEQTPQPSHFLPAR